MLQTLRSKSLFYFLLVSLCGIFITSASILWGFNSHFSTYLQENREKSITLIKETVVSEFNMTGNLVSDEIVNLMHEQGMTDNLFYQIYNVDEQLLADTTMMMGMMDSMMGHPNSFRIEDYQSEVYELTITNRKIGSLHIYYPIGLIGEDFTFFNNIKKYIFLAAIFTLFLSVLFSMLFSKRLASGFNRLTTAVRELKNHKWNVQVPVEELTDEMKLLGSSFNELALTLAKEETLRKQFTADLAHELRTPLATLRSQIEAYQDGIWKPTPTRLQQSYDELMRLVRLVNELEKLLAAENPQLKLQKTQIEANKIIALVRDQFLPAFYDKGVNLRINDTNKEYWFNGDKDRIIQILTNIVNNALLFTHRGKSVFISPVVQGQFVGFSVRDEGIGICEEDMPFLFERFYRGEKSRNRKTGGIGIGLSIVKALVDAHHGEITIQSEVNKGTTITVMFPKVDK